MSRSTLRRPEQNERTRRELLAAARPVFETSGYHGATLDQIAEAAGYTKGAVYSRFGSKADLFLALIEARQAERMHGIETAAASSPRERLTSAILAFAERLDADLAWFLVLGEFRAHARRHPALNARYASLHDRVRGEMTDFFERLYAELGATPPVPPASLADFLFAAQSGVALERAADPQALPAEQQVLLVLRMVLGTTEPTEVVP
jgi:AcrR family transcriptional regulator